MGSNGDCLCKSTSHELTVISDLMWTSFQEEESLGCLTGSEHQYCGGEPEAPVFTNCSTL